MVTYALDFSQSGTEKHFEMNNVIIDNYSLKSRWIVAKYLPSRESGEVNISKATIHRDWKE